MPPHDDTFPKLLLRNGRQWPRWVAMRKKRFGIWQEYTWQECCEKVKYFSLGLRHLGFEAGDKAAIIGENEPEWFWAEFAIQAAGGMMVGIYSDMVAAEVQYIMSHAEAKFAIAHDQEQVDKYLEMKDQLPGLRRVIYWDPCGLRNYEDALLMSFDEVLALGQKYAASCPQQFEDQVAQACGGDIAAIYYTSGTTGVAKAAMVSHQALISSGRAFLEYNPATQENNFFSYIPAAWIGEGMFATSAHLVKGVILNFAEEAETIQEDLRDIAPYLVIYGPRQWEDMARTVQVKMLEARAWHRWIYQLFLKVGYQRARQLEHKKTRSPLWSMLIRLADLLVFNPLKENFGLKRCRFAITGSAAMSIDTFRFWSALGVRLKQIYGSTEAGFVSGHRSEDIRFETLGHVSSAAAVKISSPQEILVQGPTIFSGYYRDPEKTEKTLVDGWVHTGDAGFIDAHGHLVFLDRLADLSALADGTRYAPQYIEGRLRFSPYIKDALVVGGETRNYLAVIIIIDFNNVGQWAERHRIYYTTFADLSQRPEVAGLIRADIHRLNKDLPPKLDIKKFAIFPKEFDPDEAELTRTRKLRRQFMEERYTQLVEAVYTGRTGVDVEASVKYRDGREGIVKTNIKIWPVAEDAP